MNRKSNQKSRQRRPRRNKQNRGEGGASQNQPANTSEAKSSSSGESKTDNKRPPRSAKPANNRPSGGKSSTSRSSNNRSSNSKSSRGSRNRSRKSSQSSQKPTSSLGKQDDPKAKKNFPMPDRGQDVLRNYALLVFETLDEAHAKLAEIKDKASNVDQLNVLIKAESDMGDPTLNEIEKVKVYAGSAWNIIHERRQEEGWYDGKQV